MDQPQWGLILLAFVLGLVLTFALMIRRVKREVPVGTSTGAALASRPPGAESESSTTKVPTAQETPTTKIPTAQETPTTKDPDRNERG